MAKKWHAMSKRGFGRGWLRTELTLAPVGLRRRHDDDLRQLPGASRLIAYDNLAVAAAGVLVWEHVRRIQHFQ